MTSLSFLKPAWQVTVMILSVYLPPPWDLCVMPGTDPLITSNTAHQYCYDCITLNTLHYRCFVYKQIHNGYQLSQSAEARCNLYTATEGYRTMTLTKCKKYFTIKLRLRLTLGCLQWERRTGAASSPAGWPNTGDITLSREPPDSTLTRGAAPSLYRSAISTLD